MSTAAVLQEPLVEWDRVELPAGRPDRGSASWSDPRSSGAPDARTLDDLISHTWEAVAARAAVACPVCSAAMEPRLGAGSAPVGARCRSCGSTLA